MKESMNSEIKVNAEAFAIATQMYVRLRRVSSRVIDVMYLVNNKEYAKHIIEIALETSDEELAHYVDRLRSLIDLYPEPTLAIVENKKLEETEESYFMEVTEEEIYKAQVAHHYIGALR